MCRCVEGDDVDVFFEVLQQLIKLLRTAVTVGEDLHLVGDTLRHPRLDVPQVHSLLLQEERRKEPFRREEESARMWQSSRRTDEVKRGRVCRLT